MSINLTWSGGTSGQAMRNGLEISAGFYKACAFGNAVALRDLPQIGGKS
tara:strand:- start:1381 stop:1527 length:147 start_codon:yes stop_codon:yes gene_type:complete